MRDLLEAVFGLAADALGGGVGRQEIGMLGFERLQAVHQRVVVGVAESRIVEDVVEVLVVTEVVAEMLDFFSGRHGRSIGTARAKNQHRGHGGFTEVTEWAAQIMLGRWNL